MENTVMYAMPELPISKAGDNLLLEGKFRFVIKRKDGTVETTPWQNNMMTDEGRNYLLGTGFHGDTQTSAWYIGLISNSGFSALAAGDVMSSHAGWAESTAYSQSTRPQWTCTSPAAHSITNPTVVTFNITVDSTVLVGIFIVGNNTKSGTTGVLWSTGSFTALQTLNNGDVLQIQYAVNDQESNMPLGILFWGIMIAWIVFGIWERRPDCPKFVPITGSIVELALFLCLGWRVFGPVIQ